MLKIILAEDHLVVRNGLKSMLEKENNMTIVGEADNGLEVSSPLGKTAFESFLIFYNWLVKSLSSFPDEGFLSQNSANKILCNSMKIHKCVQSIIGEN